MTPDIAFAFSLTILAGLSTGIGGLITIFTRRTNEKFLSVILGFSAGVMIYVSMIEIFQDAKNSLIEIFGPRPGSLLTVISFFSGILLIAIIDKLIPKEENPHEYHSIEEKNCYNNITRKKGLLRIGLFTAIAITIHNFPEGIATLTSALHEPKLGIAIAIAIAIHNIPEGIAVSVPVFCATGNRKKAFLYAFLSGLAEPLGALFAYLLLFNLMNGPMLGIVFAATAGIMVFISLDELLPTAREYGEHHLAMYGLIFGMLVMAISLILFV